MHQYGFMLKIAGLVDGRLNRAPLTNPAWTESSPPAPLAAPLSTGPAVLTTVDPQKKNGNVSA